MVCSTGRCTRAVASQRITFSILPFLVANEVKIIRWLATAVVQRPVLETITMVIFFQPPPRANIGNI